MGLAEGEADVQNIHEEENLEELEGPRADRISALESGVFFFTKTVSALTLK